MKFLVVESAPDWAIRELGFDTLAEEENIFFAIASIPDLGVTHSFVQWI
jgi:hypothetical protein